MEDQKGLKILKITCNIYASLFNVLNNTIQQWINSCFKVGMNENSILRLSAGTLMGRKNL